MEDILLIAAIVFISMVAVFLAVAGFLAWRISKSPGRQLTKRISRLRFMQKVNLMGRLFADNRAPTWSRLALAGVTFYLALPIDLIPDFIPFLGMLDDVVILLLAAVLIVRSIPDYVIEEHLGQLEAAA